MGTVDLNSDPLSLKFLVKNPRSQHERVSKKRNLFQKFVCSTVQCQIILNTPL